MKASPPPRPPSRPSPSPRVLAARPFPPHPVASSGAPCTPVLPSPPLVLSMYASPLPLPAFPSPSPSASAAIAAAAAAGMYAMPGMGGAYVPASGGVAFGYVGNPAPLPLPSLGPGQATLPVTSGPALSCALRTATPPPLGQAVPVATSVPVPAVGQVFPSHWAPPPAATSVVVAAPEAGVAGGVAAAVPAVPTQPTPPPKRKITRTRRRKSAPLPPADVALDQLARADLAGTTAARSRKMSASEREVMLHRRRLRNRASAARSRHKAREAAARGGAAAPAGGGRALSVGEPPAVCPAAAPTGVADVAALTAVAAEDAAAAAVATLAALPLGPTRARAAAAEAVKASSQPGLLADGAAERVAAVIAHNMQLRERNARLRAAIDTLQRAAHMVGDDYTVDGVPAATTAALVAKAVLSPQSPVTPMNVVCGVECDRVGSNGGGGGGGDSPADHSCGSLEYRDSAAQTGGGGGGEVVAAGGSVHGDGGDGSLVGSSMSGMTTAGEAVQQALVRPLV